MTNKKKASYDLECCTWVEVRGNQALLSCCFASGVDPAGFLVFWKVARTLTVARGSLGVSISLRRYLYLENNGGLRDARGCTILDVVDVWVGQVLRFGRGKMTIKYRSS